MLVAFLLFKFLVFKTAGSGRAQREGGWFVLVNLLAMLQVWVVSVGLAHSIFPWAGVDFHYALPGSTRELAPEDIAHFIGVSTTALSSFLGHKFFTFKKEAQ
jgi:putative flippase GtrA